ncbi:MAG: hypothetical protein PHT91_00080 [Candidatus Nanoarchaeia archaeon]|nr:hypothetical protein [Candidatus Nanoarchaeia archaeon]MDD5054140.1 hypothetical protein [Candidatus Nanoarchaeia archaeon]MDD5499259.1 hypothetical protein [Candidatus Nanoarchaeia archaeon]
MIEFLYSLNKSLKEESEIRISCTKRKGGLRVKVSDFKKREIQNAKIYLDGEFMGFTDNKGILAIQKNISKKTVLKAELGIYFSKKEIIP